MLTCLGRLLPAYPSPRPQRLLSVLLSTWHLRSQKSTICSALGRRRFSQYGPTQAIKPARLRRHLKRQSKTVAQEEYSDSRDAPENTKILASIKALESFLQPHLRSTSDHGQGLFQKPNETSAAFFRIVAETRESTGGIDILTELGVKNGRWSAVLSIVETLISDAAACSSGRASDHLPSNLGWPTSAPFKEVANGPIEMDAMHGTSCAGWDEFLIDSRPKDEKATRQHDVLEQIWMSLGSIIVESAKMPSDQCEQVMMYVYQIMAQLHHSGFIPDHVYDYVRTSYDSAVRRPPILNLLSSTILSTLSDAVWCAHQDEVAQATATGVSYRDLGHDAPGGRFRLKVPKLGPEVWLEFVLWCCVDGGFARAGSWIVELMSTSKADHPWSATQWTSAPGDGASEEAMVDWARVSLRHGGPVGRTERYNSKSTFAQMEDRTISVEVILALVEVSINTRSPTVAGRECRHDSTQDSISKLLTFLEPHGLQQKYFDYLTVRLLQPLEVDFEKDPQILKGLVDTLHYLRSLDSNHKPAECLPSLKLDSVLEQSEVFAGVLHQALESFAVAGWVRLTIEVFDQIRHLVDQSKLRSIDSFLRVSRHLGPSFSLTRDSLFSSEYASSHGQLPAQKLAPLLQAVTDGRLKDLGKWLFFSMDVDGPLIPLSLYDHSSLTPSILRFAAAMQDYVLLQDVSNVIRQKPIKPPLSFLRSLANAQAELTRDFWVTGETLVQAAQVRGGGSDLTNVATIISTILRMEGSGDSALKERQSRLAPGLSLLDWVLKGDFMGVAGSFRRQYVEGYRRGLACLLRVVEAIPDSVMSSVARFWIPKVGQTNVIGLNARVFDIVLSAVVETQGAKIGMILWDLFCEDPTAEDEKTQGWVNANQTELVASADGWALRLNNESSVTTHHGWSHSGMLPIRVEGSRANAAHTSTGGHLEVDGTSDDAIFATEEGAETFGKGYGRDLDIGYGSTDETGSRDPAKEDHSATDGPPAAPSADISLPFPTSFDRMISEESVPSGSMHDDVPPVDSASLSSPVVRPTFRTLRIILRAALQDLELAKSLRYTEQSDPDISLSTTEEPAKANMRVLEAAIADAELVRRWAKPIFRKFGISEEEVAHEFEWRLGADGAIFSTEDLQKRYATEKTEYELAKMGLLADLTEIEVRSRFLGPPVRKIKGNVETYSGRELKFYSGRRFQRKSEP